MNAKAIRVFVVLVVVCVMVWGLYGSREKIEPPPVPPRFIEFENYHGTEYIISTAQRGSSDKNSRYRSYALSVGEDVEGFGTMVERWHVVGPRHPENSTLRVAVVCGQHAREVITSEICHHLNTLLYGTYYHSILSPMLEELYARGVHFWILPVVNQWGRLEVEFNPEERGCLRTNRFLVDLNRNFPCPDLKLEEEEEGSLLWPGPHPLSEMESMATDQFLKLAEPEILFNVHSGIERVLLPYDCCPTVLPDQYTKIVRMIQRAKSETMRNSFDASPSSWHVGTGSALLYTAHGTLGDYASAYHNVDIALTLEVFNQKDVPDELTEDTATSEQCQRWFNPRAGEEYARVLEAWLFFMLKFSQITSDTFTAQ